MIFNRLNKISSYRSTNVDCSAELHGYSQEIMFFRTSMSYSPNTINENFRYVIIIYISAKRPYEIHNKNDLHIGRRMEIGVRLRYIRGKALPHDIGLP